MTVYQVETNQGVIVSKHSSHCGALRKADKLDLEYGAINHRVRPQAGSSIQCEANFKSLMRRAHTYNWPALVRALANRFDLVLTTSRCGRLVVVKVADGNMFVVRDAAHNCYTYLPTDEADLEELRP